MFIHKTQDYVIMFTASKLISIANGAQRALINVPKLWGRSVWFKQLSEAFGFVFRIYEECLDLKPQSSDVLKEKFTVF